MQGRPRTKKAAVIAGGAALAALLVGCGGSSAPAHVASTHAARPTPVATVHLTHWQQVQSCAGLTLGGYSEEVATLAGQYYTSQADAQLVVAEEVGATCPQNLSLIPAGDPLPPR